VISPGPPVELPLWFPRKICIPMLFLFNMTLGGGVN